MAAPLRIPPPLESGDHLTRDEFHRRYLDHPEIRAELVEGVVYVSSPVSRTHGVPHGRAIGWLSAYEARTPGMEMAVDTTLLLPTGDEVQPDACLYRLPPEGTVEFVERREGRQMTTYLKGVPDLVFEVAASSASYDLHSKKRSYECSGVPEYVVWQLYEGRLSWFRLVDGRYVEVAPDERGVIASAVFPGLRLAVAKLLEGDQAGVLDELAAG
jgi:Uma2 family endonuclease